MDSDTILIDYLHCASVWSTLKKKQTGHTWLSDHEVEWKKLMAGIDDAFGHFMSKKSWKVETYASFSSDWSSMPCGSKEVISKDNGLIDRMDDAYGGTFRMVFEQYKVAPVAAACITKRLLDLRILEVWDGAPKLEKMHEVVHGLSAVNPDIWVPYLVVPYLDWLEACESIFNIFGFRLTHL